MQAFRDKAEIVNWPRDQFHITQILHPNALFAQCRNGTVLTYSATTKHILVGMSVMQGKIDKDFFLLNDWNTNGTHHKSGLDIVSVFFVEEGCDETHRIVWDIQDVVEKSREEILKDSLEELYEKNKEILEEIKKVLKKPKPIQLYGDSITRKGLNIYSVFEYARENPGEVRFRTRNGEEWDVRNFASWKVLMGTFTNNGISKNSSFEDITSIILNNGDQIRITE